MKKRKSKAGDTSALRARAEARVRGRLGNGLSRLPDPAARRLLHELEVHQVELEMQNEELRAARLETEAGLARYTELFDFAPIGYAALTPEETIREINHAGAHLLGIERSRLVGKRFGRFLSADFGEAFSALVKKALVSGEKQGCDVELASGAEGARQLMTTATAINWGGEVQVLLAFEEVTAQREREAQLARAEAALRESERRKDEFLAVLSHELRNPLAAIRTSLFLIARAPAGGDKARKAQAIIDRQVTYLTRLVDDLLDITRITRGKIRLRRELLELGELARRTMEDHRALFEASGVRLEARFEPGLFWIDADPVRVAQVLTNILGNAEKFTAREGRVEVALRRAGTYVSLRVTDTGVGIPAELLQNVFQPFTQAPQTMDRSRGGLGIGLSMVKALVELHGGTVGIASDGVGRGVEVTISFPIAEAPVRVPAASEALPVRKRRVLVIEDNADSADALADALALDGHEVKVARDGKTGLSLAKRFRPEIVICDIGLPEMDGYAVAKAFRADSALKNIHLIALTGYAQPDDLQRALDAGFNQHLAKPTNLERLERVLAGVSPPAAT